MTFKIAIATSDGKNIDLGFGKTSKFLILEVDEESGSYKEEGYRYSPLNLGYEKSSEACQKSACNSCHGGCSKELSVEFLWDVSYVLATEFSHKVSKLLNRIFIDDLVVSMEIDKAVKKVAIFENRRAKQQREKPVNIVKEQTQSRLANRIAIASTDGLVVNEHFGHASKFHIVDIKNNVAIFLESRDVKAACNGGHDANAIEQTSNALSDCSAIVVAKIGDGANNYLKNKGFAIFEAPYLIKTVLAKIIEGNLLGVNYG